VSNWSSYVLTSEVLTNIYKNMDKMPNSKKFEINTEVDNCNEKFYIKFIKKLLNLKLDYIYFSPRVKDMDHTKKYKLCELKEICNNIDEKKYNKIFITKFK